MDPSPIIEPITPEVDPIPSSPPSLTKSSINPLVFILAVLLIGAVGFALYYRQKSVSVQTAAPTPEITTMGASLTLVEGEVEYQRGTDGWKTPTSEILLIEGDQVRVLANGRAVVQFDDGSAIRLNNNTTIGLEKLEIGNVVVKNIKGEVYSRIVKSDRTFVVATDEAQYESLGTAYKTMRTTTKSGVEVYQSKVSVHENGQTITVDEGNTYLVGTKKSPTKLAMAEVKKDEFVQWNKTQDEQEQDFSTEMGVLADANTTPTPTPAPTKEPALIDRGLTLKAASVDDGVRFSWTVGNGVAVPSGFKLVKSESANPVYPGDEYQYLSDSGTRSYTWSIKNGKTYHFRVCTYVDGKCAVYSNDVTATAPNKEESSAAVVKSITVSKSGDHSVSWTVDGYSSKGYKLVWSKNSNPVYPNRDGDRYVYNDNPDNKQGDVNAFDGGGKYYIRVCEYLGGSCGVYSNQIEVDL
jgi:hypothetical protein